MKKLYLLLILLATVCCDAFAQTASITLITAPCNNNGVLQATTTGLTPPITYDWYLPSGMVTTTTNTLTGYSGAPVFVVAHGGTTVASPTYPGNPPFNYTDTTIPAICPALGSASITITGGTSPYTVQWRHNGSSTVVATGLSASLPTGGYTVTITDAAGCQYGSVARGDTIYISNISPISLSLTTTPASCTNGTITMTGPTGGATPYSYTWSNGAHTPGLTGLVRGYYSVTVTDANGCTGFGASNVIQVPNITVNTTVTNANCLLANGSATAFAAGGASPYTYLWNNTQTTQLATGLTGANYYNVVATDVNGCTGQGYAYVNRTTPINATYTATASSCTAATGSATVSATGGTTPYSIVWSTFPVQTGATATGLAPGTYGFTITDATGCVRTGTAIVNPVSLIYASASAADAMCTAANGSASVSVAGGSTPYTYLWSNAATTSSISGLTSGSYSVRITDNVGCSVTKYANVGRSSPISLGLGTTASNCIFNSTGSAVATPTGGTAPYTYTWSNGGSTTNTISSLPTGNYYVNVTDAVGCTASGFAYVGYNPANTSCYCTITGTVYNDANANCTKDAGEAGIPNIMVHCSGRGYTFTNSAGVYSFIVPSGTYTMSESVQAYYPLASCQSNAVSVTATAATGCTNTVNFANTTATIHDMSVATISLAGPPVPGNTYYQTMIVKNEGTVTESSILTGYLHDGQLGAPSSVPSAFSLLGTNHYANNSGFSTLNPAATHSFFMQYNVPTNIPLYTGLVFMDSAVASAPMSNWVNDYTPWDNVNTYNSAVAGSFDPNFKEVSPVGIGTAGNITTKDSVLSYTIHFQNTGNYPAQKVVLVDTLDGDLDVNTLKPFASSHPVRTEVTDGSRNIITFTFNNISLPPIVNDPIGSNGYVVYRIRQKANLAVGTKIENSASIYFDYNAPVKTNTTLNTISSDLRVPTGGTVGKLATSVYPNPASDKVTVMIQPEMGRTTAQIRIVSLVGQVMQQQQVSMNAGKNVYEINASNLSSGMYFVEATDGTNTSTTKLSIVR